MPALPSEAVDFVTLGFHVSDAPANRMAKPHRHDEIEITVLEVGWIDYLFGGQRIRNLAGELCVRWAAIPHQSVDFSPGGIHYSLKVPLAWFLNWQLPESLVQRLLGGEMLIDNETDPCCSDLAMMRRWHAAFVSADRVAHRMILLETEARLLRLALRLPQSGGSSATGGMSAHLGKFERMTIFIAGNYTRSIDVADVAATAGLHPNSAMRLFRQTCGLTILEYLTMHRIWHAQHLLTEGRLKIRDIASACGFNSPNRFYAAFKRIVGQQPKDFRESLRITAESQ
ncbi:MAG: helix-turn-helix domain-containing protein [Pirellulales bacterium]